jgi:hypothetical protein
MHALHDTAQGDAQTVPTHLCSTTAALYIWPCRLRWVWWCRLRAHACIVLCMSCRKPVSNDHREAALHPALLPDLGSLHNT